ncbi:XdhC family protein (plasmid) [Halorussus salilacus]|uniref:XdhC family protein n=1 Tax=Halorussus salilacus TaxID=2953750 RepID=UPI00209FB653|nr:XdhC/CoxI family protein [Halorussus salilacus]USZ69912.1 XdhC family protein [Halorussus salilacus]
MDDANPDPWAASTFGVRESLRDRLGESVAVATVSDVEGAAYRRPGAKMVLDDDDEVGAITAGCLEGPVAELADRALVDGPLRQTFDLTSEDDTWSFGLGCNGVIDVLVEPADGSFGPALDRVTAGERVALLTVVGGDHPARVGARAVADPSGGIEATDAREPIPDDVLAGVRETAREFAESGQSDTVAVETDRGTAEVFVDGYEPTPQLLVFGSDNDVRPVSRLGRDAGFEVTVASARGARADAERFPAAHRVVAARPTEVAEVIERPEDTYAVVMSHNFVDDRLALEALLDTAVPYVGVMGPRKRFEEMRAALAEEDVGLSESDRERVATPVGLDLGGGEPMQVALSVVSEVLAVANGREGGRLTRREEPIHPRPESASSPEDESASDDADSS